MTTPAQLATALTTLATTLTPADAATLRAAAALLREQERRLERVEAFQETCLEKSREYERREARAHAEGEYALQVSYAVTAANCRLFADELSAVLAQAPAGQKGEVE